jgi:predicted Rossmann fold flavoprotein
MQSFSVTIAAIIFDTQPFKNNCLPSISFVLMERKQLIVIGGGAAGFFCAINAAEKAPDLQVTIVEKSNKLLGKVRISGGGRCNVTHSCFSIAEMLKNYPRGANFLKKAFHRFFTTDTIEWFRKRGVELKTEADGRMFPVANTSEAIINCLLKEVNKYGVRVLMNRDVKSITHNDQGFALATPAETMTADYVCIACGGFPKPEHFNWITKLGHSIEPPVPSLFTFNIPGDPIQALMGVSNPKTEVKISGTKLSQKGPVLITHWGLSGPAVLKLSAFAARELAEKNYDFTIIVNWLPGENENTLNEKLGKLRFSLASQKVVNKNPFQLPQRLWEYFLHKTGINPDIRWADLPAKQQNLLAKHLSAQQFSVKGKTTFKEEFVTAGGVVVSEIDANSMESRILPDLFFAGEIMNVDGITGGFNFQHAWTSGWIAGNRIAAKANNSNSLA